jgi:hypothetical protein
MQAMGHWNPESGGATLPSENRCLRHRGAGAACVWGFHRMGDTRTGADTEAPVLPDMLSEQPVKQNALSEQPVKQKVLSEQPVNENVLREQPVKTTCQQKQVFYIKFKNLVPLQDQDIFVRPRPS